MVAHGRAVLQAEVPVARLTGSQPTTVLRVAAAPSGQPANFEATKTYLFWIAGRIGAFVGGVVPPSVPAAVAFGTRAAGVFTDRTNPVHVDTSAPELADNAIPSGRVGQPFQWLVRYTMPATAEDVEIVAHAGSASRAYLSDLCIWWWDTAVFPTQYSSTSGSASLPRYSTWTPADSVTATWSAGTEDHLVLYSVDIGFPDPGHAWRSRVQRGASFATGFIGSASGGAREIGSAAAGNYVALWRQSMGYMRVHRLMSGSEQFRIEVASSLNGSAGAPLQVLYRSTIAAVKMASAGNYQHTNTVASLFGVNSQAGQDRLTFTPTLANESQGGEDFFPAVMATTAAVGTSQRSSLALNNLVIAGNLGLHVHCKDSSCGVPAMSFAAERQLAGVQSTLDFRGVRNPYETPQGSAQPGYDVQAVCVSVAQLPSAPVIATPGPTVVLVPGREAPSLSALTVLPIEPDFALQETRHFRTRREEMDTGHVVAHPVFATPRAEWSLSWRNLSVSDYSTLVAFFEARASTAWKWRPQHEAAEQAFVALGGLVQDELTAPSVHGVSLKALQLVWVGP